MEKESKQMMIAMLIQAVEDLELNGDRYYKEDPLTDDGEIYSYSKKESLKWLLVSGRYYLKRLGLSTVMISRALSNTGEMLKILRAYKEGT